MKFDIKYGPAYALADVSMDTGDSVQAVTGAMVSMTDGVQIATEMKGGLMAGLKRSVLGGESLFINTFNAAQAGQITLAPPLPGDIFTIDLTGTLLLQSGSLLGATADVAFDTKWGGAKTFFSGEGLFLVRCTGSGTVLASSYGAIESARSAPTRRTRSTPGTSSASRRASATRSRRREAGRRRSSAAKGWSPA